ncbi:MAG: hypothetical protein R2861_04370 [Desulfobacterales bacterium]
MLSGGDQFDCAGNAVVVAADTHFCKDFAESLIFGSAILPAAKPLPWNLNA